MPEHTFSTPSSIQTNIYANLKFPNIPGRQLPDNGAIIIFPRSHNNNLGINYNSHRLHFHHCHFLQILQQLTARKPGNRENLDTDPSSSVNSHRHALHESPLPNRRYQKREVCSENYGTPVVLKLRAQPGRGRRRLVHRKQKDLTIAQMLKIDQSPHQPHHPNSSYVHGRYSFLDHPIYGS